METEPTNNSKKGLGISISVIVLALIAFVLFSENKKPDVAIVAPTTSTLPTTPSSPATPIITPTTPIDTPKTKTSTYTDGTYTAVGSYMSPGGPDKIGVTLTLKSDIVTDVSVTPQPGDNTSARYQNIFAANYKKYVIGKNISTLALSKVSGSSLTSTGFNDAIAQIKTQANVS